MNQLPLLIQCPIESRHENLSLRSISSPRQQTTFFTPASSRFELKTSRSSYAALTYPYQSREIVTKCHNCSYKCCNQETGRWSMILKDQLERKDDLSSKPVHLDQEQFLRHQIFQETRSATGKTFLLLFFFALFPNGVGYSGTLTPNKFYHEHPLLLCLVLQVSLIHSILHVIVIVLLHVIVILPNVRCPPVDVATRTWLNLPPFFSYCA